MAEVNERRKLRVGVIGGGFGRMHILGYEACEDVEVTAFCQRTRSNAEAIAREYHIPQVFTDYKDLLALRELDAVSVAAPPFLHYPIAIEALSRGLHVLCEKPLALNTDEAGAMLAKASDSKLVHMTAFNWRFIPAMARMKELLDDGYVGRVFHVDAVWFGDIRADATRALGWRHRRELAGVGAMGDVGVHVIDWLRWLIGDFQKVSAHAATFIRERPLPDGSGSGGVTVEDACAFMGELVGGVQAAVHASGVAQSRNYQALEIYGSEGMLRFMVDRSTPRWITGELGGARGGDRAPGPLPIPERLTQGLDSSDPQRALGEFVFAHLTRRFVRGIRTGQEVIPSFREGLEAQKVLDAILKSVEEQRWVDVDSRDS